MTVDSASAQFRDKRPINHSRKGRPVHISDDVVTPNKRRVAQHNWTAMSSVSERRGARWARPNDMHNSLLQK
ncbi:MAG: hypothetical protein GY820_00450 [Gammaproteobacteria bacterium]|nr:hypothetical protein [Gammaproteobacteria bacterium]